MQRGAELRPIAQLASLVDDVVNQLEASVGGPPAKGLLPKCNAALEACLELLRCADERDELLRCANERDELLRTASDDLARLARLLKLVDGPDVPFVLRQIRRVLGRFDACGGGLVVDGDG